MQPLFSVFLTTSNLVRLLMAAIYAALILELAPLGTVLPPYTSMWGFAYGWGMIVLFVIPNVILLIIRINFVCERRRRQSSKQARGSAPQT